MSKTKQFTWNGKVYDIDAMRLGEAKDIVALQKRMRESGEEDGQWDVLEEILRTLHCPQPVIDELCIDELRQCIDALAAVQFGVSGDARNP